MHVLRENFWPFFFIALWNGIFYRYPSVPAIYWLRFNSWLIDWLVIWAENWALCSLLVWQRSLSALLKSKSVMGEYGTLVSACFKIPLLPCLIMFQWLVWLRQSTSADERLYWIWNRHHLNTCHLSTHHLSMACKIHLQIFHSYKIHLPSIMIQLRTAIVQCPWAETIWILP